MLMILRVSHCWIRAAPPCSIPASPAKSSVSAILCWTLYWLVYRYVSREQLTQWIESLALDG